MEKSKVTNIGAYTNRHLHPVKLAIGHLNRVLAANKGGGSVNMERELLESIAATIEIFVEDFETSCDAGDRKTTISEPRVSQTRVN